MESTQVLPARAVAGRPDRATRLTAATMAVLTGAYLAWMLWQVGGPRVTTMVDDLGECAAAGVGAGLCLWASRKVPRERRWGWRLLGLSALSWFLGQVVWTYLEVLRGQLEPFPSPADAGFLVAVPLAVAGVLQFLRGDSLTSTRALFDGAIVAVALFVISWILVLGPSIAAGETSGFDTYLGLAYPVGDIITLVIVISAVSRSREFAWSLGYVAAGLVSIAVSDSFFLYLSSNHALATNPVDAGWVAGFLLMGLGAVSAVRSPAAAVGGAGRRGSVRVVLPYLPLFLATVLATWISLRGETLGPVATVSLFILVALVLLRQVISVREVARLSTELARTVAALEKRERDLSFQTLHDPLTQLGNRVLFRDRLEHALESGPRSPGSLAIIFIDLDDFKDVNDEFGHDAGDRLLVAVAERIRDTMRPGDTVARLGGDEFAVIMLGAAESEDVTRVVTRLQHAFEARFESVHDVQVGVSIGVVMVSTDTRVGAADLLRRADMAMYSAKYAGKNRSAFYDEATMFTPRRSNAS